VQALLPRNNRDVSKIDKLNKAFASYVFYKEKNVCIYESGYDYQPFACSRSEVYNGEIYGRSLAMKTRPDVAMLQQIKKETIKAVHKVNDPPLLMPDDSFSIPTTAPGSLIPFRAGSDKPTPLISGAQPHVGLEFIQYVAEEVGRGFYTDILQTGMGSKGKTPISATEVNSLEAQRMRVQSQFIPRQEIEWLAPIVSSVYNIANKKNLLDEAPAILANKSISVKFSSRIVREQKMIEAQSVDMFMASLFQIAGMKPDILDKINLDAYVDYKASAHGIPIELLVSNDEVEAIRQNRAQQQQAMQQQQMDSEQSKMIKNLASVGG
jgi:hypothetical protein